MDTAKANDIVLLDPGIAATGRVMFTIASGIFAAYSSASDFTSQRAVRDSAATASFAFERKLGPRFAYFALLRPIAAAK